MGQVMVVTSGKGGTGKTTLCAGLAAGLAQLDQQVLCIDADIGLRNLDLSLGMADAATVPFIAVTANAFSEDIARTQQAGMNAHISKPIDFNVLEQVLGRLLAAPSNRQESEP